ncbi:MAG TPA: ABC transporter substrate-binding protein [Acetobacteraceae bacterium]|jgi:branched-chain amino acid transport system substrate-binding protein|nr:ABC transporter substrate-binding protein [Acetobacteraceae bacterium]
MTQSTIGRRGTLGLGLAAGAAALAPRALRAQAKDVEIVMLVPLSGPWARQGILEKMGAEMAVDDVNNAGGIRALGGAKLKLLEYDTQDTAEKAKDAAQRMLAQHPDLVGGFGCWLSTFTLAATEVTERAHLPWLTLSYSDLITSRGYKYVFQSSPTAVQQAEDTVPMVMALAEKATGKRPTKVASIGDNTAASVSFRKPIDAHVLKDQNLTEVIHEIYTPPLSDATTLVQPVRAARPDFVLLTSTNVPDDKLLVDAFNEFGMPPSKLPLIGNGGHFAVPELLKNTSAAEMEGVLVGLANWPGKAVEDIAQRFVKRTGEPWFGHDSIFAYAHVMILAAALEKAGAADREKVNDALHALDMTTGPALLFPGHHLQYDAQGRRVGAKMVMVQWQNGAPVTVFPPDVAVAGAKWKV